MQNKNRLLLAAVTAALMIVPSMQAATPGDLARSFDETNVLLLDFKDGAGIHDPDDENNPCTFLLLGARLSVGTGFYYDTLRITTNYNKPLFAIGALQQSPDGIDTGIACPIPGSPLTTLHLKWSGMNAESWEALNNDIALCTQQADALGCAPVPGSQRVWGTACDWQDAVFNTSRTDQKGSLLGMFGSRDIDCDDNQDGALGDWSHTNSTGMNNFSHNYSSTYTVFEIDNAGQGFDKTKVEDLVHKGDGTSYAVMCVEITYISLDDGEVRTALAHDYKLVLDLKDPDAADPAAGWVPAIANHLANNLQGLYDLGADNGFPCPDPTDDHNKKPAPLPGTE